MRNTAPSPDESKPAYEAIPGDTLLKESRLLSERWRDDVSGCRERTAIIRADSFKHPLLRVVERWSRDGNKMISRNVMVADHIMLAPSGAADQPRLEKLLADAGFTIRDREPGSFLLAAFEADTDNPGELPEKIDEITAMKAEVAFAEPDHVVWPDTSPDDSSYAAGKLWGLHNMGGISGYSLDSDIDAPEAWSIRSQAPSVVVAVSDTGIRLTHEDLAANIWTNAGEIPGDGLDNDSNGVIDDIHGYNALDGNGDPNDAQGHGTHTAGTIGAVGNNALGTCGVAWNVKLMACRFLGPDGGLTSDAVKTINYARTNGAHVISASWGGGAYSEILRHSIYQCAKDGIPFVAAAGNSGSDNDSSPHFPSSYDLPNVVAVAASDALDKLAGFSCYGRDSVDLTAPGWQILAPYAGGNSDYRILSGTSMATPHVAGALALARAQFPSDSPEMLIERLYASVDPLSWLQGKVKTGGRLNLSKLLGSAPPAVSNDSFDAPFVFQPEYGTWSGTNATATREADEDLWSRVPGDRTLWYSWTAPSSGHVRLTCRMQEYGIRLAAFRGDNRASLRLLADYGLPTNEPQIRTLRFDATEGETYRFVATSSNSLPDIFSLNLTITGYHDDWDYALPVSGPWFETDGSNHGATGETFEYDAAASIQGAHRSVWHRWTAPAGLGGDFSLSTEGSGIDTLLKIYRRDPNRPDRLLLVAQNDDVNTVSDWSLLHFAPEADVTYWISVDSAAGRPTGLFTLKGTTPAPPGIASQPQAIRRSPGDRAVFRVVASGEPPIRYQWFRNNRPLAGEWDSSLAIDPVNESDYADYQVEVSNAFGASASQTVRLEPVSPAPVITWTSGSACVQPNAPASFSIKASGTEPMSYQWSQDGTPIPGAQSPAYQIPSAQILHEGIYRCLVSNSSGTASTSMSLRVVSSPWEAWEWRADGIANAPISDIQSIDGTCVAVSADRLLVSIDGASWTVAKLPGLFRGLSVSKLGAMWICSGSVNGVPHVSISSDALQWSLPQTQSGIVDPDGKSYPLAQMTVFAGRLIGVMETGRYVFTSNDGVAWTPSVANWLSGTVSSNNRAYAKGRLTHDSTRMIQISSQYNPSIPLRALVTTDGLTWNEQTLSANSTDQNLTVVSVFHSEQVWNVITVNYSSYVTRFHSDDGSAWQRQTMPAPGSLSAIASSSTLNAVDFDNTTFSYLKNQRVVAWGNIGTLAGMETITPASGSETITVAAAHNGKLVFGTNLGGLGSASKRSELKLGDAVINQSSSLEFLNNEFVASGASMWFSGDGIHWRKGSSLGSPSALISHYHNGYYYGRYQNDMASGDITRRGVLPEAMVDSLPANMASVSSISGNGTTHWATAWDSFLKSTDNGVTWTAQAGPPYVSVYGKSNTRVQWADGIWWLAYGAPTSTDASSGTGYLYTSPNGNTWTGFPAIKAEFVAKLGSKWYAIKDGVAGSPFLWESSNGATWVSLSPSGLPAAFNIKKLLIFNNTLVGLMLDGTVYYSPDGVNWFQGATPVPVLDMAAGLGKLIMLPQSGYGALETGAIPAGGAAPRLSVRFPLESSSFQLGSYVDISGTCVDPEGSAVQITLTDNGVVRGTSGQAGDFVFRVQVTQLAGHYLRIRAVDATGLVTTSSLKILPTIPQVPNRLAAAQGITELQATKIIEFRGCYYALAADSLWKSTDGISWESVAIPSSTSTTAIRSIAAANGVLVLSLGNLNFAATRNGIDWSTFTVSVPSGGATNDTFGLMGNIHTGKFYFGYGTNSMMVSTDGLNWKNSASRTATAPSILPSGVMLTSGVSSTDRLMRSSDDGLNWEIVPEFSSLSYPKVASIGTRVVVWLTDGRTWTSADGLVWTQGMTLPSSISIVTAGDTFIAKDGSGSGINCYASNDGVNWRHTVNNKSINLQSVAGHSSTGFICRAYVGGSLFWSPDGMQWQALNPLSAPADMASILVGDDGFLLTDSLNALWKSTNGATWAKILPGSGTSGSLANGVGTPIDMVSFKSRHLVAGTTGVVSVSTDFTNWSKGTRDGNPYSASVRRVIANNTRALAIMVPDSFSTTQGVLCRTTDGVAWQTLSAGPTGINLKNVNALVDNGSLLLFVDTAGKVAVSTNDGVSWSALAVPGLSLAKTAAWYNNRWIIIGTDTTDSNAPLKVFHSVNGSTWTKGNNTGLTSGFSSLYRANLTAGHGKLLCSMENSAPAISTDGLTWSAFGTTVIPYGNIVTATPSGWASLKPSTSSASPAEMSITPPAGTTWSPTTVPSQGATGIKNVDGVMFVFAPSAVYEIPNADYSIALVDGGPVTLGVGDTLQAQLVFRNPGTTSPAVSFSFDGWLSPDAYFGDANDIYLGRLPLAASLPAPGTETTISLGYVLPDTILPGNMHLVVRLVPEVSLYESSLSNNTSISRNQDYQIPQWSLNASTVGNGQIAMGLTAEYYPHKARLLFLARPGKGARFAGWGGDALGSLSEALIIMDGNKSITANFANTSLLTAIAKGGGSVTLDSDDGYYINGTTASLHATPLPGWTFSGWQGALTSHNANETLVVNGPQTATAVFERAFDDWASDQFTSAELSDPAVSGPDADPDGDGLPNWREWLHASSPKDGSSTGLSGMIRDGNRVSFTYTRLASMPAGYSTRFVATADLSDWNLPFSEKVLETANGIDLVEVRFDTTGRTSAFFSLLDTRP